MLNLILTPFAMLLKFFYGFTGSYGLAVILFGLVFKIILFPISIRGRKNMLDMSRLTDKQKDLQQKYGKDRARYSEELQALYARENVKPSGGCIWSLLPMPVLIALYYVVSNPFTHLMDLTADQVTALSGLFVADEVRRGAQLSVAQQVYNQFGEVQAALPEVAAQIQASGGPINFDFFGINLSATPDLFFFRGDDGFTWANIGLFLIPIISAVFAMLSMVVNMRINKYIVGKGTSQDSANKQMLFVQPVISLWLGFTLPAALGLYWCTNSVFAILQEFCSVGMLKKHVAKKKEESEQRAIEEKEKIKEQKRLAAELKKQKAEEARRIKMERKVSTEGISESRVGIRAYARGRTYDKDRYPTTKYHDPDDMIKEKRAAEQKAKKEAEAAAARGEKKKKKGRNRTVEPVIEDRKEQMSVEESTLEQVQDAAPLEAEVVMEETVTDAVESPDEADATEETEN